MLNTALPFVPSVVMVFGSQITLVSGGSRTFTTYRLHLSHPIVVANVTELQQQHVQHLQFLQHFWQTTAYMQGVLAQNCHFAIAEIAEICATNHPLCWYRH